MVRANWFAILILVLVMVGCRPFMELADSSPETATSTRTVLAHHPQAFGEVIEAIMADYTEDSVVIVPDSTHRGLAEFRSFFTSLPSDALELQHSRLLQRWGLNCLDSRNSLHLYCRPSERSLSRDNAVSGQS